MTHIVTAFEGIILEMLEGTHAINGQSVLPPANLRENVAPLRHITFHFGDMLQDFEVAKPLTAEARSDFVNKVLRHSLVHRIGHPKPRRCISRDAASVGMVLSVQPELIHSARSIQEMVDVHESIVAQIPEEPEKPRPRVASFDDGYYLEELTTRRHFIDEGIALDHCAGDLIKIWTVPPVLRPAIRYAELQYFQEVLSNEWRHLSFGREGEGSLTTIQFNREYDFISMVGPKSGGRHTGMESYFPALIDALAYFARTQNGITLYVCETCAPVLMEGVQEHRSAGRYIHCASAYLRYPKPLLVRPPAPRVNVSRHPQPPKLKRPQAGIMSIEANSVSNQGQWLVSGSTSSTISSGAPIAGVSTPSQAAMPKQKQNYRPSVLLHTSPFPPMTVRHPLGTPPFLMRINDLINEWVQKEWLAVEHVKNEANRSGWSTKVRNNALAEVSLTPDNLARSLDNISQPTLRRELAKLNAPPPGELIRLARIEFAKHLMTHTRILGRDIAGKVGFAHYRYFAAVFTDVVGMSPSHFRRLHVSAHSLPTDDEGDTV